MRHVAKSISTDFKSSFLSCEKDQETIWRKLFIENRPYSDYLKRLLVINKRDCLDKTNVEYRKIIENFTVNSLMDSGYLKVVPKLSFGEHEEVKSYILLEFDDFLPTNNPQFRDCTVSFTIVSHLDYWQMNDYKLRPHQIAGYIDGILDGSKLSGIGTLNFMGASQIVFNEYLAGINLRYIATHGTDDEGHLQSDEERAEFKKSLDGE